MKPGESDSRKRYRVSVEEYIHYQKNGFLTVRGLVPEPDVRKLAEYMTGLYNAKYGMNASARAHMLHRMEPMCEWALLHPLLLDVVEALIGPDVLALQSMLFFNPPGRGGQGWHQDSYYIPTYPDTLIGAWMALDEVDEVNGCLWVVPGSNTEPVYPPDAETVTVHARDAFLDLNPVEHASHLDDGVNTLSRVVRKYDAPVPVRMKPGDVLFFHSHLLHRSHPNRTPDRFRKTFVGHYCNARSWVPWNHGAPFEGESANNLHLLARGHTHLPYSKPIFGTPVEVRQASPGTPPRMMGMGPSMMPVRDKGIQ